MSATKGLTSYLKERYPISTPCNVLLWEEICVVAKVGVGQCFLLGQRLVV